MLAALRGDKIKAAAPFYGFPQGQDEPDWSGLTAKVQGHMADPDDYFPASAAKALESKLRGMGKDVTIEAHPAGHGFMNEDDPMGTHDQQLAARLWPQVVSFLHDSLR